MKNKNIFLLIVLIILLIIFFISNNKNQENINCDKLENNEKSSQEENISESILVMDGFWSNILQPIDINNDGKDEVLNLFKTASWSSRFYILTPGDDGTLKLFCKNCSFEYSAIEEIFDLIDLDNDGILEVKISNLETGTDRTYHFVNNDYKLMN